MTSKKKTTHLGGFLFGRGTRTLRFACWQLALRVALLIGGASVTRASIPNVIVGVILFHLLFLVSPMAGKNLIGSGMLGEYFRQFVSYGVIALALVLYEWKRVTQEHDSRATLRGEAAKDAKGGAA